MAARRAERVQRAGPVDRVERWAAAALVASPVVAAPWGFDRFQLPRLTVQTVAVVVALTTALWSGALRTHRLLVPVGALLVVLSAAALASGAVGASLLGTSSRRFGLAGWLLLAAGFVVGLGQSTPARRRSLVRALLAASAFVAAVAVLQRCGVDALALGDEGTGIRPGSTFGSATATGAFLALGTVVATATWARGEERWTWVAPVAVLDLVALTLTRSRGAWLGAAVALGWLVVTTARSIGPGVRGWQVVWRRWRVGAGVCLVALATTAVVDPGIGSRAASIADPGAGTAAGRIELLEMGVDAFAERPLLGWGPDRSRVALHGSIPDGFEARFDDVRIEDRVHDVVVDVAVWAGVPGVAALGWLAVAFARAAWRERRTARCGALGLGLAAFGVHLVFNFPTPDLDVVVWCLAGATLPAAARPAWRAPAFVVVPVALAGLAAVAVPATDALVADRHLAVGVDRENALDPAGAAAAYADAIAADPGSARAREVYARYLLRAGRPAEAEVQARAALDAEPGDPYLAELLATARTKVAIASGDRALAAQVVAQWRALIDDSPYDASLHLGLGNALAAAGDLAGARAAYERCLELHPGDADAAANLALLD